MKKAFALAALLCLYTPALAAEPGPPTPLVEAIARQESGLNPLAVNIAGKSCYPATREEAERFSRLPHRAIARKDCLPHIMPAMMRAKMLCKEYRRPEALRGSTS